MTSPTPAPRDEWDAVLSLANRLMDAYEAAALAEKAFRKARRNSPEARERRSEGAKKGWATRRAAAAEEKRREEEEDLRYCHHSGPACGAMSHNGIGSEIFCWLLPDHEGDCDDMEGSTWPPPDSL